MEKIDGLVDAARILFRENLVELKVVAILKVQVKGLVEQVEGL